MIDTPSESMKKKTCYGKFKFLDGKSKKRKSKSKTMRETRTRPFLPMDNSSSKFRRTTNVNTRTANKSHSRGYSSAHELMGR
jgi:hypothetical protein